MIKKRIINGFVLGLFLLIFVLFPIFIKSYYIQHIMIMTGLSIILASVTRLMLLNNIWFFAQAAFYAIGAYSSYMYRAYLGISFWFSLLLAGLTTTTIALVFGYLTSRVKAIYFSLLTLALVEIIRLTIINVPFLGGHSAHSVPIPEPILGIDFTQKYHFYYFILILTIIVIITIWRIEKSPIGFIMRTISVNEELAESIGINTTNYKVAIMSICCFFIGLAGGFYSVYISYIGPTAFTRDLSILSYIYLMVGGAGSILGPVIGGAIMTIVPEFLQGKASYQNIMYACVILFVLSILPNGIISIPMMIRRKKKSLTVEENTNV